MRASLMIALCGLLSMSAAAGAHELEAKSASLSSSASATLNGAERGDDPSCKGLKADTKTLRLLKKAQALNEQARAELQAAIEAARVH